MREPRSKASLRAGFDDLLARTNQVALPAAGYAALVERLDGTSGERRPWRWVVGAAALAFAAAIAMVLLPLGRQTAAGPFAVASASRDFAWRMGSDGTIEATSGHGWLAARETQTQIGIRAGSRLRAEERGIRVLAGTADFDVEPHAAAVALRVLVSHGAIEVTGTQFLVEQGERGGQVWLRRGHLRFVPDSGEPRALAAGEKLQWPLRSVAPPSMEAPASDNHAATEVQARPAAASPTVARRTPAAPQEPATTPAAVPRYLTEIDALRIRHDYAGLAARLADVLRTSVHEPLRESLSFELCDVLLHKANDRDQACRQVTEHLRRYPTGSYTQRLQQAEREIGCSR